MQAAKLSGVVRATRGATIDVAIWIRLLGANLVKNPAEPLWTTSRIPLKGGISVDHGCYEGDLHPGKGDGVDVGEPGLVGVWVLGAEGKDVVTLRGSVQAHRYHRTFEVIRVL